MKGPFGFIYYDVLVSCLCDINVGRSVHASLFFPLIEGCTDKTGTPYFSTLESGGC